MHKTSQLLSALLAALTVGWLPTTLHAGDDYYTGEPVYELRPKPESHKDMGHIGPTGILAFVDVGVVVKIEGARKGSPAEGKVEAGEEKHERFRDVMDNTKDWAVRRGDWKLIGRFDKTTSTMRHSLHNLAEPQPEVKDHASEHPEIVRELTALHEAWANHVELKLTGGYRIQK